VRSPQVRPNALRASAQKGVKTLFDRLKNFDAETLSLNEMVELSAVARILADEYDKTGADAPDWLPISTKTLRRSIRAKTQDALEQTLSKKKSLLEASLPAEDRRKKLAEEIAELEKKMAGVGV
jgi:hypothetical protein